MSGTVNIARSIFDHAVFADEPKTEREAWIWLIMKASWKARAYRVGNAVVHTERGQLAASVRYLASEWQWTPAKVQRYLKRLEKMDMLRSQADTGVTVLTICNYDEYQSPAQASDTAAIQQRYSADTRQKKEEIREEGKKDADASSAHRVAKPSRFQEFWDAYPHRGGKKKRADAEARYAKAVKAGIPEQSIIDGALNARNDPSVNRGYARDPTTWLNQEGWTDEFPSQPNLTIINGGPHDRASSYDRQASNANSSARQIAFAARAGRAPSADCF
ncbi:hypothetical protein ACHFJ0_04900 [Paracoccus sp. NGMCC 1.201697]|uniref:Replication protein n=1 Tax=Paracoccus broussonetiae subsp. drimophilus TaxID=3373869 RepID=A0ABW7LHC7_9RHOB